MTESVDFADPTEDMDPGPSGGAPNPTDPDAPYGRRSDGTAYRTPPEERERLVAQLAAARAARGPGRRSSRRASAPPRKPGAKRAASAPAGPNYADTVAQLLQLPVLALGIASRFNRAFALDAATITYFTPPLSGAIADQAAQDARLAAMLDRCMALAPAGPLLGIGLALCMQMAANHGKIPPNPELGILTPEQLMDAIEARTREAA